MKRHRTKITQELIDKIVEMAKQDVNITDIAKQLNINRTSIYRYLRTHLPEREYQMHKEVSEDELNTIQTLYLTQGMTPTDIAIQTRIPHSTVKAILKREGLTKPRNYGKGKESFKKALPKPIEDTIYYPERKVTYKSVEINGKRYIDVSEVYGL